MEASDLEINMTQMGSGMDADEQQILGNLPEVTDEMLEEVLRRTEGYAMSFQERQEQLVSFVWGNALENDRGTRAKVCEHLHVPLG